MLYLSVKRVWLPAILLGLSIGVAIVFSSRLLNSAPFMRTSYADIITPVMPFAVSILTNQQNPVQSSTISNDPILSRHLLPAPLHSTFGSGILISQTGLVVTNAHVISNAENIVVVSHSGLRAAVTDVWIDPETDIALLKTNLMITEEPPINLEREYQTGDLVFTLGNPFGIGQSVSMGIIAASARQQPGRTALTDFIQTDAAINPGNSGGALINAYGEIIGMNSAIFSEDGSWQGIGFALSISEVLKIAHELAQQGEISRGYLGIDVEELREPELDRQGIQVQGVRIIAVQTGSPAEQAGVKPGDILMAANQVSISDRSDAARLISSLMPNKKTSLTLLRQGEVLQITVTLAKR